MSLSLLALCLAQELQGCRQGCRVPQLMESMACALANLQMPILASRANIYKSVFISLTQGHHCIVLPASVQGVNIHAVYDVGFSSSRAGRRGMAKQWTVFSQISSFGESCPS